MACWTFALVAYSGSNFVALVAQTTILCCLGPPLNCSVCACALVHSLTEAMALNMAICASRRYYMVRDTSFR